MNVGVYNSAYYIEVNNMKKMRGFGKVAITPRIPTEDSINWKKNSSSIADQINEVEKITLYNKQDNLETPDKIVVKIDDDRILTLHKLTTDIYNKHLIDFVNGHPELKTDDEVQRFFLTTNFSLV